MVDKTEGDNVAAFLVRMVTAHPNDLVRVTAERFGISRQAVHRTLGGLIRGELIQASGRTRNRRYSLGPVRTSTLVMKNSPGLDESRVWADEVRALLEGLPTNVLGICEYGFTEMLNNVIDHSDASEVAVEVRRTLRQVELHVQDDGIGIFRKIRTECGLASEREAILELSKGKLTTDPAHHTGEGIFFTSRMFDDFVIESGAIALLCLPDGDTWAFEPRTAVRGTQVSLRIDPRSTRMTQDVFDRFAGAAGGFSFDRTRLVVRLVEPLGSALVSRSQAKRVVARLERFREVVLDFAGVESMTPAFADEIFRVFASAHPQVRLLPVHENEQVRRMIQRATDGLREQSPGGEGAGRG